MDFWLTFRIALLALGKNKMRAGLTVLGVVIGIAAVTAMISIGQSARSLIQSQFEDLGTNVVIIVPAEARGRGGVRSGVEPSLKFTDAEAINNQCPSVLAASAIVGSGGQQVVYGNANCSPREIYGVGTEYLTVRNWDLLYGGFFTQRDVDTAAKVCVIGRTVVANLFQTSNPLGQTIRINKIPFRIIGVLEQKGANIVGQDQDDIILAPYTTVMKRLRRSEFKSADVIMASARSVDGMENAVDEINNLLYETHRIPPGSPADFEVQNTDEIAQSFDIVTGIMTAMLASIAGVSLIVGGVGIMNIMLVSVTERTREIGIRMAVGARSGDILRQFLVESIVLSMIGGVIGFSLGAGGSVVLTILINNFSPGTEWPILVSMEAGVLAFSVSGGVGVFFGFYPALRASRLDPIDALRYE